MYLIGWILQPLTQVSETRGIRLRYRKRNVILPRYGYGVDMGVRNQTRGTYLPLDGFSCTSEYGSSP